MSDTVPVLLVIFNRPGKTRRVIEALRQVKPARLFVAADGPRAGRPDDVEKCRLARQAALEIDWPCDLQTRFLDENVGCGLGVASGISWFFGHVDYGIIIEDDCVPHPHLFPFCGELLERFKDDERIMQVSGYAPYSLRNVPYDYHFSRAFRCWGWGTWRRAWAHFSLSLDRYDRENALELLRAYYPHHKDLKAKSKQYAVYRQGVAHNWDFQWNIACFAQNALCIVPERNLISNIGIDGEGTHSAIGNRWSPPAFCAESLSFPLRHPPFVFSDGRPERSLEKAIYRSLPIKSRCSWRLRHALGALTAFWETRP